MYHTVFLFFLYRENESRQPFIWKGYVFLSFLFARQVLFPIAIVTTFNADQTPGRGMVILLLCSVSHFKILVIERSDRYL